MRNRTGGLKYRWGLLVWCSLAVSLGLAHAADDPATVVTHETGDDVAIHSLAPGAPVLADGSTELLAPTAGPCTSTPVPFDGATSGNGRAPVARYAAARGHYLILQSELAAAGISGPTTISAIGWRYSTAPGVTGTAPLKIYLENVPSTEIVNNKTATWVTAIATMTLVHNSSTTLPNSTTPFDVPFSVGSFSYTGGALYVAYDWGPYVGTLGTAAVVSCNSSGIPTGRQKQANSAAVTLGANSAFGPETRLTAVVPSNDAGVSVVYSLGSLAQPYVGPQTVQALVTNRGANALTNVPVTFNLTGANTFSDVQNVPSLAACGGSATVTFAPFTPTATGSDTVTVSVPADDNNANNSGTKPLDETFSLYSYKYPGSVSAGGAGLTGADGAFVAKFTTAVATKVSEIKIEFFSATATTYRAVIYPDSGSGTPGLVPLYEDVSDRTVLAPGIATIALPTPLAIAPGSYYVGAKQTNTTNASVAFDLENPIRSGAFFFATPNPPALWTNFSPGNNFKLNIGVTLIQCTTAAECNDNNLCTDDACTSGQCVYTNANPADCDGNTCSSPDQCVNQACVPGPNPCDDGNACTLDLCTPDLGGGSGCSNVPVSCDDGNPCTTDSCDPGTGCGHANNTAPCTDGNPCTIGDVCGGGACIPGAGLLPRP